MKQYRSSPKTLHRAWELRKEQTPAEEELWKSLRVLKNKGFHFRRQHAIGPFIVDFCAPGARLIIEIDGNPHRDQVEIDAERTTFLNSRGYRVLRFWNSEVLNDTARVMRVIVVELGISAADGDHPEFP